MISQCKLDSFYSESHETRCIIRILCVLLLIDNIYNDNIQKIVSNYSQDTQGWHDTDMRLSNNAPPSSHHKFDLKY